ncbi:MAG: hypothetical protein L6R19_08350 [Alphaproteobacteria bacterium]|nr:hypothetical protein [Alphaproteobacteria bacterium]
MPPIIRKSAIALAFSFTLPFAAQAADPGVAADKITFGADDNQGMDEVFVTVLQKDGTFKAVKQLTATGS